MAQDERQVHWKGTDGDDTHVAGPLDSELDGGKGDDTLTGSLLSDTIYGGDGDDTLFGLDGKDCIYGGQGNDRLIGGRGNDNLYGGLGANTFVFMAGDGSWDQISDFGAGDIIEFRGIEGGFAGLEIRASDRGFGTEVHYGDGGDVIILWGLAPDDLDASDFRFMEDCEDCEDDGMSGSGHGLQTVAPEQAGEPEPAQGTPEHDHGGQTQQQGAGSVQLSSAEQHTGPVDGRTLTGGDSDDTLKGGKANDLLSGGMGDDTLMGSGGNDQIYGGTSNAGADQARYDMEDVTDDDWIHGKRGDDFIDGGMGDDTLHGGKGKDKLFGGMGDDTLYGGKGVDHLEGGQGNDRLIGGEGYDCYYGGLGNDTLVFSIGDGNDHVSGFEDGDIIELRGVRGGFDGLDIRQRDDGQGTEVRYGDGDDMIILWGVTALDENDFSFVVA